jgi:hypothetical protein
MELNCILNENIRSLMKNNQMIIVIVAKSTNIKITKSTHDDYIINEKKITLTLNNFNNQQIFVVGMTFDTAEVEFVEVVKVSYRYMVNFY